MKRYMQNPEHRFAPQLWRHTHNITGDHVFDASIERCKNRDAHNKVGWHCAKGESYGYKTAYSGYSGLAGDD